MKEEKGKGKGGTEETRDDGKEGKGGKPLGGVDIGKLVKCMGAKKEKEEEG